MNINETIYADDIKTAYDRRLLTRAKPRLIHNRFGKQARVSRGFGSLEYRKLGSMSAVTTALVSGVTPHESAAPTLSKVVVTPAWYGAFLEFGDEIDMTAFDPLVLEASAILGEQSGLSVDTLTRNALVAGATDDWSNGVASRALLNGAQDKITAADLVVQAAQLDVQNARGISGDTKAMILHPFTYYTLLLDPVFMALFIREGSTVLREGRIGRLVGYDLYVSSNAASYASAGVGGAFTVYSALFIAAESYGVWGLGDLTPNFNEGTDAQAGMPNQGGNTGRTVKPVQIIMNGLGSAGAMDPLGQRATIAWKATHDCQVLDANWIRDLEHITDYS